MTYSILAFDPESGELGTAVASCSVAVGGTVTCSRFGGGLVNTQHYASLAVGHRILDHVEEGRHPQEALDDVLARRQDAAELQLLAIDVRGGKGAWTGSACHPIRAHRFGPTCVVGGNMLASEDVVDRMVQAFESSAGRLPLGARLLATLEAGERAGGDRRGRQAASIFVLPPRGSGTDVNLDLRVDDHPDPLVELRRLHGVFREAFGL